MTRVTVVDLETTGLAPPEVEPGPAWTPAVKARCAAWCGDRGDPPCWDLPNLTSDSPPDIQPCSECLGTGEAA